MSYFVYIIQSQKDSTLYIGHTNDLDERILRHNQGRSKYTKTKRPWKILHSELFETRSEAVRRENELKSLRRRDLLFKLIDSAG